jgi:hypothetical protein
MKKKRKLPRDPNARAFAIGARQVNLDEVSADGLMAPQRLRCERASPIMFGRSKKSSPCSPS